MRFFSIFLIIYSIFLLACKKEKPDEIRPVVNIISPAGNSFYSFGDTVFVHAVITDDQELTFAGAEIQDTDGKLVYPGNDFPVKGTSYSLKTFIVLNNEKISESELILKITAKDSYNSTREYISITVQPAALSIKSIFVATGNGSVHSILKADSLPGQFNSYINSVNPLSGFEINSFHDQLFFSEQTSERARLIDLISGQELWQEFRTPGIPYVKDAFYFNKGIYYVEHNGTSNSFTGASFPSLVISAQNFFASQIGVSENYMLLSAQSDPNGNTAFRVYSKMGSPAFSETVTYTVKEVIGKSEDEFFLVGDDGTDTYISVVDAESGNVYSLYTLGGGTFNAAGKAGDNAMVIAHQTGIFYFTTSSGMIPINSGIASDVFFDMTGNTILAGIGNELKQFSLNGQLLSSATFPNPVTRVRIRYNR